MKITKEMQVTTDFDWFLLGKHNEVLHFTSVSGFLPKKMTYSLENLELLFDYFINLKIINPDDIGQEGDCYFEMARRGLFSYDRVNLNNSSDFSYKKIKSPNRVLKLSELDNDIQEFLMNFKTEIDVKNNPCYRANPFA